MSQLTELCLANDFHESGMRLTELSRLCLDSLVLIWEYLVKEGSTRLVGYIGPGLITGRAFNVANNEMIYSFLRGLSDGMVRGCHVLTQADSRR